MLFNKLILLQSFIYFEFCFLKKSSFQFDSANFHLFIFFQFRFCNHDWELTIFSNPQPNFLLRLSGSYAQPIAPAWSLNNFCWVHHFALPLTCILFYFEKKYRWVCHWRVNAKGKKKKPCFSAPQRKKKKQRMTVSSTSATTTVPLLLKKERKEKQIPPQITFSNLLIVACIR